MDIDINIEVTPVYRKIEEAFNNNQYKYIFARSGTSTGKTIAILQLLFIWGMNNPNKRIVIVSESLPKAKDSVIVDMKDIVMGGDWVGDYNIADSKLTLPNKTTIKFKGAESPGKVTGPRQDVIFYNEVDLIDMGIVEQASIRSKKVLADFNPRNKWELITDLETRDDYIEILAHYKDNIFLAPSIVKDIEERAKRSPYFKRCYVDGEWGNLESAVFTENEDWTIIDELPDHDMKEEIFSLDWGYTHPTAIVKGYLDGNSIYIQEQYYESGKIKSEVANEIKGFNPLNNKVVADSEDAEGIASLRKTHGINIQGTNKYQRLDSIDNWKERQVFITADSTNLIKELRNWQYSKKKKDKKGRPLPEKVFDDIIDAARYLIDFFAKPKHNMSYRGSGRR